MVKKKTNKIQLREWLNKDPGLRAHVLTDIEASIGDFNATFNIADCNRNITLDFSIWFPEWNPTKAKFIRAKKEYEARKEKVETLRKHLTLIDTELDSWWRDFETKNYAEIVAKAKDRKPEKHKSIEELLNAHEHELED